MVIKNASVFMPDGVFRDTDLSFDERILGFESAPDNEVLDAAGALVIPGLVDIHTHGAAGRDHSDGDAQGLAAMSEFYARHGVTGFCATTLTMGEAELKRAMETVRDFRGGAGAVCLGVNLEGPFLSRERKGAQDAAFLRMPDIGLFRELYEASGASIRLVTTAPELPGAMDFIREASKLCAVSVGHSDADYDTAMAAFEAGASSVTHLHNAMPDLLHRKPGVIGAAQDAGVTAELICDGFHVHPSVVRATFRMFGGRVAAVSDSLRCTGMPDGEYELAGLTVSMANGKARLPDGTIAGSTITLLDALRSLRDFGIPLRDAIAACTATPASIIGRSDIGAIKPGNRADLLVLDKDLNLKRTIIGGKTVFSA